MKKAIKNFEAAKVCSDRPNSSEAEEWIAKAQNGYIDRLQLIASKYLTAEAESAFDDKKYRIAFRLCQEALKYKKDNEDALALQDDMLPYLADYQYDLKIDPRFYHPNQIVLSDNQLTFFEENIDGKMLVKLIDLEEKEAKGNFEISGNIFDYQFSPDGNWLAVVFYNAQEKRLDLSLFNVATGNRPKYSKIFIKANITKLFYSVETAKNWFIARMKPLKNSKKKKDENGLLVKSEVVTTYGYAFNVVDLESLEKSYKSEVITDFFTPSSNSVFIPDLSSTRQDLVNEKIAMKYASEGVITTNTNNFVLNKNEFRIREHFDFSISPDGKKLAFFKFGNELRIDPNFSTEIKITFGPAPRTITGTHYVVDLEKDELIFNAKSEFEEVPQRMLPFGFSKNSRHFLFLNSRKMTGLIFNENTKKWETTESTFPLGFNIFNLEKDRYHIENLQSTFDYFVTENDLLVYWSFSSLFQTSTGKFNVFDMKKDTSIFSKSIRNEFSHFYDVNSTDEILYFTTYNPENQLSTINQLSILEDTIVAEDFNFIDFKYTYLRTSKDKEKVAFLVDGGSGIRVFDAKDKKQIREIKCQSRILEFDFSNNDNYLITRDKEGILKIVDLKITDNLFNYFDNHLEQLTEAEREEIGIDW